MTATSYYVLSTGTQQVTTRPTVLLGFSLSESTGTGDAEIDIFDGTVLASAKWITGLNGAAGECSHESFGPEGIQLASGLLVNVLVGQAKGVLIYV